MIWLWLTVGMFAKAVQMSVLNYTKYDPYYILGSIVLGIYVVGKFAEEYTPGDRLEPWAGLPFGFALGIAFMFKDRLLPTVTEGTLFGYSLVAGYIFFYSALFTDTKVSDLNLWLLFLINFFILLSIMLLFSRTHLSTATQAAIMTAFLGMSAYIGYELAYKTISFDGSGWELIIIGFGCLSLLANVFYILYFIPIPGKRQTFKQRLQNIRQHAHDLEEKYVTVDSTRQEIFLTILLFIGLVIADYYNVISQALLISITLLFISLVHVPPEKSRFTPLHIQSRL